MGYLSWGDHVTILKELWNVHKSRRNATWTSFCRQRTQLGMDYLWPAFESRPNLIAQVPSLLSVAGSGGGGGFNKLVPTPAYQKDVSGVNTFNARNYLSNLDQPILRL